MIQADHLGYLAPGGATLLRGITLAVAPGERLGIVGPSGAGKTTLGYHLCGLHALALTGRSTGGLRIDGRDAILGGLRGFAGMVLQNPETQIFCTKVEDEVALGLPPGSGEPELAALLARTGLLGCRRSDPATLSLGWKQRLSIAGMLAMAPKALLLDEPTNFLDPAAADTLFDLLGTLRDTAVMVVDHDEHRLRGWADRIIRVEAGQVAADVPAAAYPEAAPMLPRQPEVEPGEPLLLLEEVHHAYRKNQPVLTGLSLEARAGELIALLGANGSGKTTLLRLAKGLLQPTAGRVRTASGRPLMKEVGLVFQNPDDGLFAATVEAECAFLPANLRLDQPRARARAVLERLGLAGMAARAPFTLSYGEKRRVNLAAVLSGGARILCLDEPTVGLDRPNLERLADLLRAHAEAGGCALFATHDAGFAAAVATRTVRLDPDRP